MAQFDPNYRAAAGTSDSIHTDPHANLSNRKGSRASNKAANFLGMTGKEGVLEANGVTDSADDLLHAMGYEAELKRTRSTWQVAFMSFVLASIPYGLATTFFYPLVGGGPATIIWGWVAVSIIILCVAISLGEITSVYPTAGGVYYQSFMLAPVWCRNIVSWICGWLYVIGNITITLAVNFGTTLFLVSCINIFQDEEGTGVFQAEVYQIFLIFLAITILCNLVSALGNKWLPWLDVSSKSLQPVLAHPFSLC
jgi:amino acid permease